MPRRLLSGDYEAGLKMRVRHGDEVAALAALLNKFAEQLRAYDALRADRVAFSYRAIEMLHRNVRDPVLIADVEKAVLRLNPAAEAFPRSGKGQDRDGGLEDRCLQ